MHNLKILKFQYRAIQHSKIHSHHLSLHQIFNFSTDYYEYEYDEYEKNF